MPVPAHSLYPFAFPLLAAMLFPISTAAVTVGSVTFADPGATVRGLTQPEIQTRFEQLFFETPAADLPPPGSQLDLGRLPEGIDQIPFAPGPVSTVTTTVRRGDAVYVPLFISLGIVGPGETTADVLADVTAFLGTNSFALSVNGVDFATESGLSITDAYRHTYPGPGDAPIFADLPEGSVIPSLDGESVEVVTDGFSLVATDLPVGLNLFTLTGTQSLPDFEDPDGPPITVEPMVQFEVTVAPVPLPAALAFLLAGLGVLVAIGRRPGCGAAAGIRAA